MICPRPGGNEGFLDPSKWDIKTFDPSKWPTIVANAHKFANKHGFKLYQA